MQQQQNKKGHSASRPDKFANYGIVRLGQGRNGRRWNEDSETEGDEGPGSHLMTGARGAYEARFCFLNFAHRAFCASEIRLRAAAERCRPPPRRADRPLFPTVKPCNAFTAASRPRNSFSTSARLVFISARIRVRFTICVLLVEIDCSGAQL
jgi:hypothetical protein